MNYFFITLGVLFIIYIFVSIKRNEFTIEESAFWIVGSIVVLFLSIFWINYLVILEYHMHHHSYS